MWMRPWGGVCLWRGPSGGLRRVGVTLFGFNRFEPQAGRVLRSVRLKIGHDRSPGAGPTAKVCRGDKWIHQTDTDVVGAP